MGLGEGRMTTTSTWVFPRSFGRNGKMRFSAQEMVVESQMNTKQHTPTSPLR